jgi:hypothetical protein
MTDKEVIKSKDDLEMMKRPHLWPLTFLPLINKEKKDSEGSPHGLEGLLFYESGEYLFLRGQNMYLPIPEGANFESGGTEMLQQLVKEGWRVD